MGQLDRHPTHPPTLPARADAPPELAIASIVRQAAALPPERRAELRTYLRELDERCWVCNRPDGERIRLERRDDRRRWHSIGSVVLCEVCLTGLSTPILAHSLRLDRVGMDRAAPAPRTETASGGQAGREPEAPASTEQNPPLVLIESA